MKPSYPLLLLLLCLAACRHTALVSDAAAPVFEEIPTPVEAGGEPNLFVSDAGRTYLSWIGYLNDTTETLYFSTLENGKWGPAMKIAQGTDWFVNWADFPSLAAFSKQPDHLAAHWLQKRAAGTYDYDVHIAGSKDGGKSWSPAFIPHTDGIAAEHGFVSLLPMDNGNMLAVWLDGRNTKGSGQEHDHDHGHGGAMTLRAAEFDVNGQLFREAQLDDRTCDCCQTDAALTPSGPIVLYRDRSEQEVRDINLVKYQNGAWTAPRRIHEDNWEIKGCPVNGPAIATQGRSVAIAWYTAADDQPQVKAVLSSDEGETYSSPVAIDDGKPLGRVDVVWLDDKTAVVSWLEETTDVGEIRLAKINAGGKIGASITATTTGVSRQSGFPILERIEDGLLLAWTSVQENASRVRTMRIQL